MPRILIQAGHKPPLEPGHERQTGADGEVQFTTALQERLVAVLGTDDRFAEVTLAVGGPDLGPACRHPDMEIDPCQIP